MHENPSNNSNNVVKSRPDAIILAFNKWNEDCGQTTDRASSAAVHPIQVLVSLLQPQFS